MENKDISLEKIKETMGDLFYGKSYSEMRKEKTPYVRKLADNSWEIFSGEGMLRCNDAGKELFDKALKEACNKIGNNGK